MSRDGRNPQRGNNDPNGPPPIGPPGRRFAPFLRRGYIISLPTANPVSAPIPRRTIPSMASVSGSVHSGNEPQTPIDISPPPIPPRGGSRGDGTVSRRSRESMRALHRKFPLWSETYLRTGVPVGMNDRAAVSLWLTLRTAIEDIQIKRSTNLSFEPLYRNAYNMVLYNCGEQIYEGLREITTNFLQKRARERVMKSLNTNLLSVLNKTWNDHLTSMSMIRNILMYLDRMYVPKHKVLSVFNLGLTLFRDYIIRHPPIQKNLRSTLLGMVMSQRDGDSINHMDMKMTCNMLMVLGIGSRQVYEEEFEKPFLSQSVLYFQGKAEEYLQQNNAGIYIRQVETLIEEECMRAAMYLDKGTEPRIVEVVKDVLIRRHMKTILDMENSGLVYMIRNVKIEDLACLYQLLCRLEEEGLQLLVDTISTYMRTQGRMIVEPDEEDDSSNPVLYIRNLLDLKDRFDYFTKNAFDNDRAVQKVIASDFEYLLNLNGKSPEYLSLFIDDKLKKSGKGLTEEELSELLDKAMVLFRFIADKDVFERYYKTHLARRLLLNKSLSSEYEMSMVSKLKGECGYQFTSKLDGMFKDISISAANTAGFKKYVQENNRPTYNVELTMDILTSGFWPITPHTQSCYVPTVPRDIFDEFTIYYLDNHVGRKIELQPHLGHADVMGLYGPKKLKNKETCLKLREHVFQVSTYQMFILLLFNEHGVWTYSELAQETNIPSQELQRVMQSLSVGKTPLRLLNRTNASGEQSKEKEIQPKDQFRINENFSSKYHRIKIHNIGNRGETEAEGKETRVKIDENRKIEIEAAIVRIMKSRRLVNHNLLVADVMSQLKGRFQPSPIIIKRRIEDLIEREYLARAPSDRKTYVYVA